MPKTKKSVQNTFPSIRNGAARLGIPPGLLAEAKRDGAPGFNANGTFRWPAVREFICEKYVAEYGCLPEDAVTWLVHDVLHDTRLAVGALRFYHDDADKAARAWLAEIREVVQTLNKWALERYKGKRRPLEFDLEIDWSESPVEQLNWYKEYSEAALAAN